MPSRIITPPDQIKTRQNILVINATTVDLTNLVIWLKTVPDNFDVHLYHNQMPETDWALEVAETAETILVSKDNYLDLKPEILSMIDVLKDRVVYFGDNSDYPDLVHFFLTKKELI